MTMSVLVKLNASNQELIDDLDRVAPRERAERIRMLAMMGLLAMRSRGGGNPAPEEVTTPPPAPAEASDAKARLKGKLLGSLS